VSDVDTTVWGRVATTTQLTKSFVSDDNIINSQDVGFDGLSDGDEQTFFDGYLTDLRNVVNANTYQEFFEDPAGDDYHYFRGSDYDQEQVGILDRYKKYNGPDGNSVPASLSPESYTTSASTLPDVEDVNSDNTLNEYERYYQYRVSLRPQDMNVGENYISDVRTASVTMANGTVSAVKWYQFKVPVKKPEEVVGSIADFSSIRFMRMFLKHFNQPIVLRFATLDLVRADWRIYTDDLEENSNNLGTNTSFAVSAVNIEENSDRAPVNYVLPPKIDRVIDPSNAQLLELNEQAMTLNAQNLEQGDARAAYKSINLDFRPYKRLKLDIHAEAIEGEELKDDDLYFFIRLGSDYNDNYYEYELPLALTPPGVYNNDLETDRYLVWPDENRIDIPLSVFTDSKLERNEKMRAAGSAIQLTDIYEQVHSDYNDDKNLIKIKGNPNLANVAVMMMGIRNKSGTLTTAPKSIEVWVNELRLTNLSNTGGWAANTRVSTKLADLGTVVFAGSYRSAGFGSIDQSASERSTEDLLQYDISSNFDLGRFFPEKAKVKIPLYVGISKSVSNPEYNPLDPDITMKETYAALNSKAERDSVKRLVQDYSKRTSIVLNNVKVDKTSKSGKPRLWDPTNFSASFAFNKQKDRDVNTQYSIEKTYRLALNYNFNARPKLYEPFKKVKFLRNNAFRLLRDFNFYLMPTQISYRNELYRYYYEVQSRNISEPDVVVPLTVEKDFLWRRYFDLKYNLSRSLKIDFSSQGTARIDEPEGRINRADDDYQMKKDSILRNLLNLGRPILYHHSLNVTYQAPINKIPAFNWVTATGRYQALYDWTAGSITDETVELGNVIENSRIVQGNGQMSLINLYNKIDFLKEVNRKFGTSTRSARSSGSRLTAASNRKKDSDDNFRIKEVAYRKGKLSVEARKPVVIEHNLKTTDVQVKVYNEDGQQIRGVMKVLDENRLSFESRTAIEKARVEVTGKRKIENSMFYKASQYAARTAMMVKNFSLTYTASDGTYLPGYLPEPSIFGSGQYTPDPATFGEVASSTAPGIAFLLGWQDDDFAKKAAEKGWITKDTTLNDAYVMTTNKAWTFRANVEPLPFLTIDLTGSHSMSENKSEYYLYDAIDDVFNPTSRTVSGSFSMSINTLGTAFSKMGEADVEPPKAYRDLLSNRYIIAHRLSARRVANEAEGYNPDGDNPATGYPYGYGPTSQEVLIPAFIAAYTGQSPEKVSLEPFPSLKYMRPNWRITYNGVVSKIEGLNKVMKSMSLSQTYRSTYNVGSYATNLNYDDQVYGDGWSYVTNNSGNFVPQFDIASVNITELFNPLINVDITWLNDLSTTFQINRTRNLSLNFANVQLTEVRSNELSVGLGYRFPRMDLIIKSKNGQKAYSNDLNINMALAFAKNKTVLRKLTEEENQLTAGQKKVTIKTTADYMLSDRFQLRLYYDKVVNNPFTSSSYPTKTTSFGMSFRFTLAQ
jgi:cell surface protein SprA